MDKGFGAGSFIHFGELPGGTAPGRSRAKLLRQHAMSAMTFVYLPADPNCKKQKNSSRSLQTWEQQQDQLDRERQSWTESVQEQERKLQMWKCLK
jgi:gas vesicle protein